MAWSTSTDNKTDGAVYANEFWGNGVDVLTQLSGKAESTHDHDTRYASIVHNHDTDYSDISHNHNTDYSLLSHNHDTDYADIAHNHDTEYADIAHNHDTEYVKSTDESSVTNGWTAVTYNTGWEDYEGKETKYRKTNAGIVYLYCSFYRSSGSETIAFTLPEGCRPPEFLHFNDDYTVYVYPNGDVSGNTPTRNTMVSFATSQETETFGVGAQGPRGETGATGPGGGPPVGTVEMWHKSDTDTPTLNESWVECSGQTCTDTGSVYYNKTIPDYNDAWSAFNRGTTDTDLPNLTWVMRIK